MRGGNPSGDTARTLILVGLVFDFLAEMVLLVVGIYLAIATKFPLLLGILFVVLALVGFVWVALVWVFSYERTRKGEYDLARTPTLVLGVLSLLTGAIIPGILFLIASAKLGDASGERRELYESDSPVRARRASSTGRRVCPRCGFVNPPAHQPCPGCGYRAE